MKYIIAILICVCLSNATQSQNIIRVSPVVNEGDFTNLQMAIDAATSGDILMVYPGSYGSIQVNKALKIYGPGYRIPENPSLGITTIKLNAQLYDVVFLPGSAGTEVSGFYMSRFLADGVSNLVIKRNFINHAGSGFESRLKNANGVIVQGNYFYMGLVGQFNTSLMIDINCSNVIVENNVFDGNNSLLHTQYGCSMVNNSSSQIIFRNNISMPRNTFHYSEIYNNIFFNPNGGSGWNFNGTNNYATNNLIGIPGNTFVGWPTQGSYSFDSRFQLAPGSPAMSAGVNGEDLGIFGGDAPYKLSGIPSFPLIYDLFVPMNNGGNSININIKVRSEN